MHSHAVILCYLPCIFIVCIFTLLSFDVDLEVFLC